MQTFTLVVASLIFLTSGQNTQTGVYFAKDSKPELLWNQGEFTEGPAWGPDNRLYFSDIGNRILQFNPADKTTKDYRNPSGRSNGLEFDLQGNLIAAEGANTGGNRRISITLKDGSIKEVASKFEGKRFNSPNDLVIDSRGNIYFTDPRYVGSETRELDHESVFMIDPKGKVSIATRDAKKPNGICISPDGKTLFLAENDPSGNRHLLSFAIHADGMLHSKKVLHDFGKGRGIDGMCVDNKGNVFATAGSGPKGGIYVFSTNGKVMDFVQTPEDPSNCCFGGKGSKTLYITAGKSLYRIETTSTGYHPAW